MLRIGIIFCKGWRLQLRTKTVDLDRFHEIMLAILTNGVWTAEAFSKWLTYKAIMSNFIARLLSCDGLARIFAPHILTKTVYLYAFVWETYGQRWSQNVILVFLSTCLLDLIKSPSSWNLRYEKCYCATVSIDMYDFTLAAIFLFSPLLKKK